MGVRGCSRAVKYLLFLFNVLILLAGLAAIAIGLWVVIDKAELEKLLDNTTLYTTGAYILIACGAVTVLVSALGCLGAIKEVRCMLVAFFLCLTLLFLLIFIGGILVFAFHERVQREMRHVMESSLKDVYGMPAAAADSSDPISDLDRQTATDAWDFTQRTFRCCGVDNHTEPEGLWRMWQYSAWYQGNPGRSTPGSCCLSDVAADVCASVWPSAEAPQIVYQEGCYTAVYDFLNEHVVILISILVALAVILIVGMVLAISLCKHIRDD